MTVISYKSHPELCAKLDAIADEMGIKRSSHTAFMTVNFDVLLAALNLPPDTQIKMVIQSPTRCNAMLMQIEHPDLQEVANGDRIPNVKAALKSTRVGDTDAWVTEFDGWRQ